MSSEPATASRSSSPPARARACARAARKCCTRSPAGRCSPMCSRRWAKRAQATSRSSSGRGGTMSRPRRSRRPPARASSCRRERRGTAHAVLAAREAIARGYDDILVDLRRYSAPAGRDACGDAGGPGRRRGARRARLRCSRSDRLRPAHRARRPASRDPRAQGRDAEEKARRLCNAGPIGLRRRARRSRCWRRSTPHNAQNEYYLTDLVEIANAAGSSRARSRSTRPRSWASTIASSSPPPRRRCRRGCGAAP